MSRLYIRTGLSGGRTVISDSEFTAPLKIAKPFYHDSFTEVMLMTASAGILEGDSYDIEIYVSKGTALKFTGQSYTKLFKADKNGASQHVRIFVESGGKLIYRPCPIIPFGQSIFECNTEIYTEHDSVFAMCDILSCGRAAMNERFEFTSYRSRTAVYVDGKIKFLDNVRLIPKEADLLGIGFFEGHTHMGMIYVCGSEPSVPAEYADMEAASSKAESGICIRAASDSADDIQRLADGIFDRVI